MWEIQNYHQVVTFILSLCLGALCCAIYDVIRAARRVSGSSIIAITIGDILLWIFYAVITFIFLISRTNGEIRGYVLFGEFLGFVLFHISISKFLFFILHFIFNKISFIKRKIYKYIDIFYNKFELLILKIIKYLSKMLKRIKKGLKNTLELLYTKQNIGDMEKSFDETNTKA